jgi:hypothetical protein
MDQNFIADAEFDILADGGSALFTKSSTNKNQSKVLAVYDQDILDAVESAMLRGNSTRASILKSVPALYTIENAEAYINRVQWEFRQTSDGVDRDSERIKMTKVLWDVIRESYEALDREKQTTEPRTSAVASILKNIVAAEQRISTLLGLNAPQTVDMRMITLIQELGPEAVSHYKAMRGRAKELTEDILN